MELSFKQISQLSTYNCRVMCVVSHLVDFHWNCDINPNYHAIYIQFIRLGSRGETNWAREAFASAASFNASTNTHSLIFAINNDGAVALNFIPNRTNMRRRVLTKPMFLLWCFLSDILRRPWMEALRFVWKID
ncbi:hypothetical protein T12_3301 [Trichinella patagoniensis]|uniref:Uncharacterized protein n=1 Tax=Trichinella patagoniensis TaxID=990121 RepID=A0A0V0ZVN4_9BILA|nr:hypothetical protein T12_3301 [Trichinella patagoniensis]